MKLTPAKVIVGVVALVFIIMAVSLWANQSRERYVRDGNQIIWQTCQHEGYDSVNCKQARGQGG